MIFENYCPLVARECAGSSWAFQAHFCKLTQTDCTHVMLVCDRMAVFGGGSMLWAGVTIVQGRSASHVTVTRLNACETWQCYLYVGVPGMSQKHPRSQVTRTWCATLPGIYNHPCESALFPAVCLDLEWSRTMPGQDTFSSQTLNYSQITETSAKPHRCINHEI